MLRSPQNKDRRKKEMFGSDPQHCKCCGALRIRIAGKKKMFGPDPQHCKCCGAQTIIIARSKKIFVPLLLIKNEPLKFYS